MSERRLTTWIPKFLRLIPSGSFGGINSVSPLPSIRKRSCAWKVDVRRGGFLRDRGGAGKGYSGEEVMGTASCPKADFSGGSEEAMEVGGDERMAEEGDDWFMRESAPVEVENVDDEMEARRSWEAYESV
jgi:hypothetical protein